MSDQDRSRWNSRYSAGAYGERTHPCVLLEQWLAKAPQGRALDVACGAGRNALYLARQGYQVDAIDISGAALEQGAQRANAAGVAVNWQEQDLDSWQPTGAYELIVVVRYADLSLLERLIPALQPGGVLLVEAHLGGPLFSDHLNVDGERLVGGPGSERFRLSPGALADTCASLERLYSAESHVTDPDARLMALAAFVGRRPLASAQPGPVGR